MPEKAKGKSSFTPSMLETLGAATAIVARGRNPGPEETDAARMSRGAMSSSDEGDDHSFYDDAVEDTTHHSAGSGITTDPEEGDNSLPLRGVRYSFDAEREEELDINTGDMVEIVDDSDEHWVIARRVKDGRQGELLIHCIPISINRNVLSRSRSSGFPNMSTDIFLTISWCKMPYSRVQRLLYE